MSEVSTPPSGPSLLRATAMLAARLGAWLRGYPIRTGRGEALVRMSADWYFETDSGHRFTRFVAAQQGPVPRVAVLGKTWSELPGVESGDSRWTALRNALQDNTPIRDFEFSWRDVRGRLHYLLINAEPILGLGGRLRGWRGLGRDCTAQKEAEQALNASESQLAAIIDSAMDAIITIDTAQRVVVFNESAGVMFGCLRAAALGLPLEHFLPQGLRAIQAAQAGRPAREPAGPIAAMRAGGQEFPVEAAMSRIAVNGRELYSITLRDLTERQALERVRAALESQLRESQKMEALGTMAGGIAHDFNNIVAAMLGNAGLARASLPEGRSAQVFIGEIRKGGVRARDVVQRIMAFSRRQPAVFSCQPLQPLIEEAVQLLRATLPSGIEISCRLPELPLYVAADATQISQVVMNLGANAWQALGSQPGRIRVRLMAHGDQEVKLQVSDDGCGMDEATVQRIFEPFFTTKAKGEGTGLGLPVVHGIVQAHGGRIEVHSRKGDGTTFDIFLPLTAGRDGVPACELAQARPSAARGQGQHVVYLDDYPAMVFMMKATLDVRGYRTTGFEDAQSALEYLRGHIDEVDLVVSDYNMPGKSGLEVAREIRRLRPELPVILASGYLTDELRDGAARVGVRHLFDKPRGIEEMCDMIGEVLSTAAAAQESKQ